MILGLSSADGGATVGLLRLSSLTIIIIIIAFQGAIRDFLQSSHSSADCLLHVRSSGLGAIMCKSRATHRALITCKCRVTCHLVRRDSSAIKLDRVEIAFIWAYFIGWIIKPMKVDGVRDTGPRFLFPVPFLLCFSVFSCSLFPPYFCCTSPFTRIFSTTLSKQCRHPKSEYDYLYGG